MPTNKDMDQTQAGTSQAAGMTQSAGKTKNMKQQQQQLDQSGLSLMQEIGELANQIQQQSDGNAQVQQAAYKIQQLSTQAKNSQQTQQ